jgi:cysteine desulfuration protein SufE
VTATVADKLDQISAEFAELEPRERLELLLEFAEKLAPLPSEYQRQRDAGLNRVTECQTPVFLWAVIESDQVRIFADVAPEAPTVKGFVSVLVDIFSGAKPAEVIATDPNLIHRFGLAEALGMVRMRGMQAIAQSIRQRVVAAMAA